MDFATALKTFRISHPYMSQSQVAKRAYLDHSYIHRLELNERLPSREAVKDIAAALNLNEYDTDSLFVSAGFVPPRSAVFYISPELRELQTLLNALPFDRQLHIITLLTSVINIAKYLKEPTQPPVEPTQPPVEPTPPEDYRRFPSAVSVEW